MERYNFKGFYGCYGHIFVKTDGSAILEMISSGKKNVRRYKSLKGARIALSKLAYEPKVENVTHLLKGDEEKYYTDEALERG